MTDTTLTSSAQRLRDPQRWRKAMLDLALFFMAGLVLTTLISRFLPGYPILVATPSIDTGVYWLNKKVRHFYPGDFVTFPFAPGKGFEWLTERYGEHRIHTKKVLGVAGDTVFADSKGHLRVCRFGMPDRCVPAGVPQGADSKGQLMPAWVPPNHQYTLQTGEIWVYGQNAKSLDSRYHGPVRTEAVKGKASLLLRWAAVPADPADVISDEVFSAVRWDDNSIPSPSGAQ